MRWIYSSEYDVNNKIMNQMKISTNVNQIAITREPDLNSLMHNHITYREHYDYCTWKQNRTQIISVVHQFLKMFNKFVLLAS